MNYLKRLKQGMTFLVSEMSTEPHKALIPFIAFILGVVLYFRLPFEPNVFVIAGSLAILTGGCFIPCSRVSKIFLIYVPLFLLLGIFNATLHTYFTKTNFLPHAMQHVEITGIVQDIETKIKKTSIDIVPTKICVVNPITNICEDKLKPDEFPDIIRLSLYQNNQIIHKKDIITGHVNKLTQPAPPITPFGFYQARTFWFEGIGAVGTISDIQVISNQNQPSFIDGFRKTIHDTLQKNVSQENAGIAEALILGNTNYVSETSLLLYRTVGLSHILSVSGFHIGLIAFLVYGLIRGFFSLLPERISFVLIKRFALIMGLISGACYVILAGAQAPSIRSFIMIGLLFTGMFFDRQAISLRNVVIAAVLMVCWAPHLVLSVGFQLSFMAVLCLTAVCDLYQKHKNRSIKNPFVKLGRGFLMILIFNICVTCTTAPIIAFYFHQIQTYAVVGNMVLSFIFGFLIIPILFICVLLIYFPIVADILQIVDGLLSFVTNIGSVIMDWPFVVITVPYFYTYGLICWIFGLVGLIVFQSKIRWFFVVVMSLVVVSFYHVEKPYAIIGGGGSYVGAFIQDKYHVTESYFYPQWHTSFLLYDGHTPNDVLPVPIQDKYIQLGLFRYAWHSNRCQQALLNVYRKGMEKCPNLVSFENMLDWHTLTIYQSEDSTQHLHIRIGALRDKNRPWRLNVPLFPLFHAQISVE